MKHLLFTICFCVQLYAYGHTPRYAGTELPPGRQPVTKADWQAVTAAIRPGMHPHQVAAILKPYRPVIMPGSIQGIPSINYFLTPRLLLIIWYEGDRGAISSGSIIENFITFPEKDFLFLQLHQ